MAMSAERRLRVMCGVGAYNEERTIGQVLARFEPGVVDEVIVVDDGSTDRTPEIVARAGVRCLRHETRQGVGASIKTAVAYARQQGYDVNVVMAGNGKDDPRQVPRLLAPILEEGYDYVQGSRYVPGGSAAHVPRQRAMMIHMLAAAYRLLTGFPSTDPSNGFRAYRFSLLDDPRLNIWQDWLDGYEMEHYINYLVLKLGYRAIEVPVSKTYPGERGVRYSHVRWVVDWWQGVRPIVYLALGLRR
jgi:dolichol-phosphate mannosyltransferase